MPFSTIRGTLLALLQNETWDFDPARGFIYRTDYVGAGPDQMKALQEDYTRAGIASRLTFHRGDSCSLEVEDSTQAYTIDTWQIVGNEESRDGLGHPALAAAIVAANPNWRVDVTINDMRENLKNNADPAALFAPGGRFYGYPQIVQDFYDLQIRGAEEYRHAQYVLRHTTNAPNRYTANISDVGVETVYTTAKLLTECTNPNLWIFPLPARLQYKIGQMMLDPPTGINPPTQSGYIFGWLKSPSTETTAANNRIDITTEYTLEQWPVNVDGHTGYYLAY